MCYFQSAIWYLFINNYYTLSSWWSSFCIWYHYFHVGVVTSPFSVTTVCHLDNWLTTTWHRSCRVIDVFQLFQQKSIYMCEEEFILIHTHPCKWFLKVFPMYWCIVWVSAITRATQPSMESLIHIITLYFVIFEDGNKTNWQYNHLKIVAND